MGTGQGQEVLGSPGTGTGVLVTPQDVGTPRCGDWGDLRVWSGRDGCRDGGFRDLGQGLGLGMGAGGGGGWSWRGVEGEINQILSSAGNVRWSIPGCGWRIPGYGMDHSSLDVG